VASDIFLKIDGVTGESTDQQHSGEIELASWNFDLDNPPNIGSQTSGAGTGRVKGDKIHCVAQMSKASPSLFEFCTQGKHFTTATLTCRKAGGAQQNFLVLTMDEVYIARYETSFANGNNEVPLPYDNFTLAVGKLTFDYLAQTPQGTTQSAGPHSWDFRSNQGT
jgi:type VI secretion system secreted protein Hcp